MMEIINNETSTKPISVAVLMAGVSMVARITSFPWTASRKELQL
jgi:hypothetical protein